MSRDEALLTTLEGRTPRERREALVERVKAIVDADFAAYVDLTPVGARTFHYDNIACVGTGNVAANWLTMALGTPSISPWDPQLPPRGTANRFRPGADIDACELAGVIYDRHYIPFGLCRERRMLVYHGEKFAGWIGVSRHLDARPFTRADERRVRRAAPRIVNLVTAEKLLRDPERMSGSGRVVLHPDGRVEVACETAAAWLSPERREVISHHVRCLERDPTSQTVFATDGLAARLLRLSGDGRVRYLCSLEATRSPRLSPLSRLTKRQREVSELIVVGATAHEVAAHLAIGVHTVREHIAAIYQRLGVASRVELGRVFVAAGLAHVLPELADVRQGSE